jgi:sortase A
MTKRSLRTGRLHSQRPAWVRPAQAILLAAGLILLSYAGVTLAHGYLYQTLEGRNFDRMLQHSSTSVTSRLAGVPAALRSPRPHFSTMPSAKDRGPIARIRISRIGLNTLVLPGDNDYALSLGAGHIPGTAWPWQAGNVGIAGHRDTFFRRLRNIRKNDSITLETRKGTYTYRVETVEVVDPSQLTVLGPTPDSTLTLITCYPFYFVGAAPERFIVRARRISSAGESKPKAIEIDTKESEDSSMSKHFKNRSEQTSVATMTQQKELASNVTSIRRPPNTPARWASTPPQMEEVVRRRAYEFYEQRGRQDGQAQEDWLRAEEEVLGTLFKRGRIS